MQLTDGITIELVNKNPIEIPAPEAPNPNNTGNGSGTGTTSNEMSVTVTYKVTNDAVEYKKGDKTIQGLYADLNFTVEDQTLHTNPDLRLSNGNYKVTKPAKDGDNHEEGELSFTLTAQAYNFDKDGFVTPASDGGGRSWSTKFKINYSFQGYRSDKDSYQKTSVDYLDLDVFQRAPVPSPNIGSTKLGGETDLGDTTLKDTNTLDEPVIKYVADDKRKPDPEELKKQRDESRRKLKEKVKDKLKVISKEILEVTEDAAMEIAEPYMQYINTITEIKNQTAAYYAQISMNESRVAISYRKLEQLIKGGVDGSPGIKYITSIEESVVNCIISFNNIYNKYIKLTIENDSIKSDNNALNEKDLIKLNSIKWYLNEIKSAANINWTNDDLKLKEDKSLSDNLSKLYETSNSYKEYYKKAMDIKWDDSSALVSQLKNFNTNVTNLVIAAKSGNLTLSQTVIDSKAAITECKHLKELVVNKGPKRSEIETETNTKALSGKEDEMSKWVKGLSDIDDLTKLLDAYGTYSKMGKIEFESVKGSTIYLTTSEVTVDSIPGLKNSILTQLNIVKPVTSMESLKKLSIKALARKAMDDLMTQLNQLKDEILGKLKNMAETLSQVYESIMALFKTAPKSMIVPMASVITTPVGPAVHVANPLQIQQSCDTIYASCQSIIGLIMKVYDAATEAGIPNNMFDPIRSIIDSIVSILLAISLIVKAVGGL